MTTGNEQTGKKGFVEGILYVTSKCASNRRHGGIQYADYARNQGNARAALNVACRPNAIDKTAWAAEDGQGDPNWFSRKTYLKLAISAQLFR